MTYSTQILAIGDDVRQNVLVVTDTQETSRLSLGYLEPLVSGYCRTKTVSEEEIETWFLYPGENDMQIKNWIAVRKDDSACQPQP